MFLCPVSETPHQNVVADPKFGKSSRMRVMDKVFHKTGKCIGTCLRYLEAKTNLFGQCSLP